MRTPMSHLNLVLRTFAVSVTLVSSVCAQESPQGGTVVAGSATIVSVPGSTTINQLSTNAVLDWQRFDIGGAEAVRFVQPGSSSVALNRVLGTDPSRILGSLSANGKVFLVNPSGILFGAGAQVNVGGLVASTRKIANDDFMAGNYSFNGGDSGAIVNHGSIAADGGYVALLGASVSNEGAIEAQRGSVALAAGNGFTLDVAGDGLLHVAVTAGAVDALARNGGLIRADGGQVLITARSADGLMPSAVNNDGVIQAQTLDDRGGTIRLLGDMASGTVDTAGTLDASAPAGGDGGHVETSAAHVRIATSSIVSTHAASGSTGHWLIDPADFTIAASGGDLTGAQLSTNLALSNVIIHSGAGGAGIDGDIHVNDTVSWGANTLTLSAARNIDIATAMLGTGTARLALEYGQGAIAAGNTATVTVLAPVDLPGGNNFSMRLGSNGSLVNFAVLADMTDLQNVNGNLAGHFALGSNLDASGVTFTPLGPIAQFNDSNRFAGTFDGLGHTISNLAISGGNFVGLFGAADFGSVIRNLGLENVNITGGFGVGGMVGVNSAAISNSHVTGTVHGADAAGGLIGYSFLGSVDRTWTNVAVSTDVDYSASGGGIVGFHYFGRISDSLSLGPVTAGNAGGIAGINDGGTINTSYSASPVHLNVYSQSLGGLVGWIYLDGRADGSVWNLTTSGTSGSGGGTGLTTAQLQAALPAGFSPTIWGNGDNQTTPYLLANPSSVLIASNASGTYYDLVLNLAALQGMNANRAGNYALGNDIDASPTSTWNGGLGFAPIGTNGADFSGNFDGLGHVISGLTINRPATDFIGLFGKASGAVVHDVGLDNVRITGRDSVGSLLGSTTLGEASHNYATGRVDGQFIVGGLIGYDNTTAIEHSHASVAVTGDASVGGLIGETNGGMNTSRNFATGAVTGLTEVGGLVGYSGFGFGIVDSYATGDVSGDISVGGLVGFQWNGGIVTSYATGLVSGNANTGGLVGSEYLGSVADSYWNSGTSGQGSSAGGVAMTSAQMQQRANFTGWDFATVWTGYDSHTNPLLRSGMTALTVSAANATHVYDGHVYNGGAGVTYSRLPDMSHLYGTLAYSGGSAVGNHAIAVSGLLSDQSGYVITYAAGTLAVDPYAVSLTGARGYDGTGDVAAGLFTIGTLANGETLSLSGSGTANRNVGSHHPVTLGTLALVDGTGLASNYTLSGGTQSVDIAIANLTLGTGNVSKTYDGGLGATGSLTRVAGTLFSGDTLGGGSFAFTSKDAGSGNRTVTTGAALVNDGNGGGNYHLVYVDNTTSTITPAVLSATITAADKAYDGNRGASTSFTLAGLAGSEQLAVNGSATFNSKDVLAANLVTVGGVTLADGSNGGLARNYSLAAGQTAVAHITPRLLSVFATADDKIYDGNTIASARLTLAGLVGNETLTTRNSATFNSKDVLTANRVTLASVALGDGGNGGLADNYRLASGMTTSARITARMLTVVGESAQSKVFDGSTTAILTGGALDGVVPGETVVLLESGEFASAVVGSGISVTAANTLGGAAAANYALLQPVGLLADITAEVIDTPVVAVAPVYVRSMSGYQTAVGATSFADRLGISSEPPPPNRRVGSYGLEGLDISVDESK
jgi:filamentous hemagglutinin family protein